MVNRKWCTRNEIYLLFDLFKAFDKTERIHKSEFFSEKTFLSFTRAQHSELPFNISIMPGHEYASIMEKMSIFCNP